MCFSRIFDFCLVEFFFYSLHLSFVCVLRFAFYSYQLVDNFAAHSLAKLTVWAHWATCRLIDGKKLAMKMVLVDEQKYTDPNILSQARERVRALNVHM